MINRLGMLHPFELAEEEGCGLGDVAAKEAAAPATSASGADGGVGAMLVTELRMMMMRLLWALFLWQRLRQPMIPLVVVMGCMSCWCA